MDPSRLPFLLLVPLRALKAVCGVLVDSKRCYRKGKKKSSDQLQRSPSGR